MLSAPMNRQTSGTVLCQLNDGTLRWVEVAAAKIMQNMRMLVILDLKRNAANK